MGNSGKPWEFGGDGLSVMVAWVCLGAFCVENGLLFLFGVWQAFVDRRSGQRIAEKSKNWKVSEEISI